MNGSDVDDVVVVERHHHGASEDVEIVDQADQDVVGWRVAASGQQGAGVATSLGNGSLNRSHKMRQEPPEFGVAWVEGQPRHAAP